MWLQQSDKRGFYYYKLNETTSGGPFRKMFCYARIYLPEYSFKDLEVDVNTGLVDFTGFRENIVKKVEIRLAQTNNYAFGGKQEEQDDKKNGQT